LSNKLRIIALLLPVSLFSGCNGTTDSGNSEVSVQSNSPTTTTTSSPIAGVENPSPTTNKAVRIARWSRDPNGLLMSALHGGSLAIVNNCLVVTNKDMPPFLPIFPYDEGVWDDATQTFTFHGKVIRIGSPIQFGGGTLPNFEWLKVRGKYDVPDCGITHLWVAH
jgi:hypothetical protein